MKIVTIGLPIVVIAGAAAAAPYVIGQQIEQRFRAAVTDAEIQLSGQIDIEHYDRGWLSSSARTAVTIGVGEGRTFDVVLDHDIHHGPWPSLNFGRIVTTIHQTEAEKKNGLAQLFDGPSITMSTELPFSGGYRISLDSPRASGSVSDEAGDVRVDWQGLHGTIAGRGEHVLESMDIRAPGLTLETSLGDIFQLSGLTLTGSSGTDHLADDTAAYNDWNGHGALNIDEVALGTRDAGDWARFAANTTVDSTTPGDDRLDYRIRYSLSDVILKDPTGEDTDTIRLDNAGLAIALNGLRASAIKTLFAALDDYERRMAGSAATTSAAADEQRGRLILDALPSILANAPELVVEIPAIQTSEGSLGASVSMALVPMALTSSADAPLAALIQRASVDASAFADASLVQRIADSVDDTQSVVDTLNALVNQGFLVLKDDQLSVRATVDANAISLNGKILPPELERGLRQGFMQGLAEGL